MNKQKKRKRNWLVEDNLVALYIALYEYKGLNSKLQDIRKIIPHKGFPMRILQFVAIHTNGKKGLKSGLECRLFKNLYKIFKDFKQEDFALLVNSILKVKSKISPSCNI